MAVSCRRRAGSSQLCKAQRPLAPWFPPCGKGSDPRAHVSWARGAPCPSHPQRQALQGVGVGRSGERLIGWERLALKIPNLNACLRKASLILFFFAFMKVLSVSLGLFIPPPSLKDHPPMPKWRNRQTYMEKERCPYLEDKWG